MLLSLHIGNTPEIAPKSSKIVRTNAVGDIRTNIRLPGGNFAVSIESLGGDVKYGAVNAAPMGVNGHVCVRWKPPHAAGVHVVTLWKQKEKPSSRPVGPDAFRHFLGKHCTKVTSFQFTLM